MKATPLRLDGLMVLEPLLFRDERGAFFESFNARRFRELVGAPRPFVQDNHSTSRAGVLRGLHYQKAPAAQGKLVRALRGAIFDVAVDIRPHSPGFGQWEGLLLSDDNRKQLWIPPGFAHGFLALTDCEVLYKADAYYNPALEGAIRWDDPAIAIAWPLSGRPLLSPKDEAAGALHQVMEHAPPPGAAAIGRELGLQQSFD